MDDVRNEARFEFGKNWEDFSGHISPEDYAEAKKSLAELAGDLKGKSFLDIGCGSGLFSVAASGLGAAKVTGFDLDENSVKTSKGMLKKAGQWDASIRPENVEFKAGSILDEPQGMKYDVVYSWGVLHHTGDMYKAFDAAMNLVAENGTLIIAIYNKHFTSPIWKVIKFTYVKSPAFIQKILIYGFIAIKYAGVLVTTRRNPVSRGRGMRFYHDVVDWVGGYPYEYASIKEVTEYFEQRGFATVKVIRTQGWTGCNEFVFTKKR